MHVVSLEFSRCDAARRQEKLSLSRAPLGLNKKKNAPHKAPNRPFGQNTAHSSSFVLLSSSVRSFLLLSTLLYHWMVFWKIQYEKEHKIRLVAKSIRLSTDKPRKCRMKVTVALIQIPKLQRNQGKKLKLLKEVPCKVNHHQSPIPKKCLILY